MKQLFLQFIILTQLGLSATITPASISAESTFFTYNPQSLIDGSGLSNSLHDSSFTNMWLSDNTFPGVEPFSGRLSILFANPESVTAFRLWNYNFDDAGQNPDLLDRGARDIQVSYLSGGLETTLGIFTLDRGTGQPLSPQLFVLNSPVLATEFRLSILTNYGDRDYVGLSEVQFLSGPPPGGNTSPNAIPEPTTLALLPAALGWLLLRHRASR